MDHSVSHAVSLSAGDGHSDGSSFHGRDCTHVPCPHLTTTSSQQQQLNQSWPEPELGAAANLSLGTSWKGCFLEGLKKVTLILGGECRMSGRAVPDIAGISGTRRVFTFPLVNSSQSRVPESHSADS
jgi:hypothetical protein